MKSLENGWMVVLVSLVCVGAMLVFSSCRANAAQNKAERFATVDDGAAITLKADGKDVLSYYYAVKDVPAGVDPLFKKSGFVHPLWSPAGKTLTRIQAPDHYHHYGIWAPWTLTHIEGREVDFWNLSKGQGTVRFAGVEGIETKGDSAVLRVKQEHVDFTADKAGRVSIVELLEMKARPETIEGRPAWVVDYTSRQKNVLNVPIELDAYRYGGGLGFRATEQWTAKNCSVLTSEGKTRAEADGTRARWCDVNGGFDDGSKAGIVFLSHPSNRDYPEPMRVWPLDTNKGRGDMFFEFCPIRLNSWTFEPQKEYVLRYRMIVYDGAVKPETAESLWKEFSQTKEGEK